MNLHQPFNQATNSTDGTFCAFCSSMYLKVPFLTKTHKLHSSVPVSQILNERKR